MDGRSAVDALGDRWPICLDIPAPLTRYLSGTGERKRVRVLRSIWCRWLQRYVAALLLNFRTIVQKILAHISKNGRARDSRFIRYRSTLTRSATSTRLSRYTKARILYRSMTGQS